MMANVRKIAAGNKKKKEKLRVAAYVRVSTKHDEQEGSFKNQLNYYYNMIDKNDDWQLVNIYSDWGISGTKSNRPGFQEMLDDCDAGKIDIILTKSISRFARNTVILLETVRHLKKLGISVRFERENIDSLSADGELMLTLLASFAQEESVSTSENIKWGVQKKYEKGLSFNKLAPFGYRWIDDENLEIVPEEAKIVRMMYDDYLNGDSYETIASKLNSKDILSRRGVKWSRGSVCTLMKNETHTGDLLLQKFYSDSPITHKLKPNRGELPQYLIRNHHEPIISHETFDRFLKESTQRQSPETILQNKVSCPVCGKFYRVLHADMDKSEQRFLIGTQSKADHPHPAMNRSMFEKITAETFNIANFDLEEFITGIDHVYIDQNRTITYIKNGQAIEKKYPQKEYFFTGKIRCEYCGMAYNAQNAHQYRNWRHPFCNSKTIYISEEKVKTIAADLLPCFNEKVDYISVDNNKQLTFHLKNGDEIKRAYERKNNGKKSYDYPCKQT